jgi:LacI family transcriptional regulator
MSIVALAKDLNLSVSTVSRALNGYNDVSAVTRQRVEERAKELGYRANPAARRLKGGKSSAVGVVLPAMGEGGEFLDSLYSRMLGGVAQELERHEFQLLVTKQSSSDASREAAIYEQMISGGWVDALIIVRARANDPRVGIAQAYEFPFVTYGRTESKIPHAWVDADNEGAFQLATSRQLEHGHRRIALLNGRSEYSFARFRLQGYTSALRSAGIAVEPELVLEGDLNAKSGYTLCGQLLALAQPPTSLLCATDVMAIGAMAACRDRGLQPGRDIAVMGYGNSSESVFTTPPLTTMEHDPFGNGVHLGSLLLKILNGEEAGTLNFLAPVSLVARQSDVLR